MDLYAWQGKHEFAADTGRLPKSVFIRFGGSCGGLQVKNGEIPVLKAIDRHSANKVSTAERLYNTRSSVRHERRQSDAGEIYKNAWSSSGQHSSANSGTFEFQR